MRSHSIRRVIDGLLDGRLDELIAQRRTEGISFNDIAAEIEEKTGHRVTAESVRQWHATDHQAAS